MDKIRDIPFNQIVFIGFIILSLFICICIRVSYFNIFKITKNYISIFKNDGKYDIFAIYMSLVLPMLLALYVKVYIKPGKDNYESILLIITILTALFFSALGIILSIKEKVILISSKSKEQTECSASKKERLNRLTNSVFYTDMFEIMISILILIFTFINDCLEQIFIIDLLIYYLIFVLLINMLVLLKRFNIIIDEQIK